MKQQGFTLPELLVALLAFSLVIGGAANLLLTGIAAQRHSLASEEVIDQTSFLSEYMSRALRQAIKDVSGECLSQSGRNYEVLDNTGDWLAEGTGSRIRFINANNQCHEFRMNSTRVQEAFFTEGVETSSAFLTSDNLEATLLSFYVKGASQDDDIQPRAAFVLHIRGQGSKPETQPELQLQTTVSQRTVDVLK